MNEENVSSLENTSSINTKIPSQKITYTSWKILVLAVKLLQAVHAGLV
jgi:hypothetical protein